MHLSVVTTLYRSAPYLEEFCRRAIAAASGIAEDVEIVLVDDGSPDESLQVARRLLESEPRIRIVELSRNYGHHRAVIAGLRHTRGALVFLIDCDLEEAPELLGEFLAVMRAAAPEDPVDLVYGVQARRKGGLVERLTGRVFYALHNRFSDIKVPANAMMARLMTRRYVRAVLAHKERELFLLGVMTLAGFRQVGVVAAKGYRGPTTYTLGKRILSTLDAVTSFSQAPLYVIFSAGLVFSALSAFGILYLLFRTLVLADRFLVGWTSMILVTSFFGGMILCGIGVLGMYLSKVFIEVKRRPTYIVKRIYARAEREVP